MNRFRNLVLLLCLLFVLPILSACKDTDISIISDPPIITETTAAETTLSVYAYITPITYTSLEELLEVTDIVIIGTVQETLPAVRLTQSENTLWDSAFWEKFNVTPSLVQVEEVLKMEGGEVSVVDTIRIDQFGGFADNVTETIDWISPPDVGSRYLMFITFNDSDNTNEYMTYEYSSIVDGFMKITDGKVYPPAGSLIFESGISVEDVKLAMVPEVNVIPDTMPDDFAIYFAFWINPAQKNFMDTYVSGIQKDLILNGTHHSELAWEREDLEAIYAKMQELAIFDLSGNVTSDSVQVTPNEIFLIRYRINGHEYTVSGDSTTEMLENMDGQHLHVFMEYLREYMINTTEYKAMPESEGGYD